jgi:hypothetical protein
MFNVRSGAPHQNNAVNGVAADEQYINYVDHASLTCIVTLPVKLNVANLLVNNNSVKKYPKKFAISNACLIGFK